MTFKTIIASAALALSALAANAEDFNIQSPDIANGGTFAAAQFWNNFGCTGENVRPSFTWSGAPEGTKSFAITLYDKDAPTGSGFWHWVVYNIPGSATGIDGKSLPAGAIANNTDVGTPDYAGPCPPEGTKHNYVYTLHALKTEKIEIPAGATAPLAGFFIYNNTIATTTLSAAASR